MYTFYYDSDKKKCDGLGPDADTEMQKSISLLGAQENRDISLNQ